MNYNPWGLGFIDFLYVPTKCRKQTYSFAFKNWIDTSKPLQILREVIY